MLEIQSDSWGSWKKSRSSKFEKSIPYALLCQVAGLKEYIGANPILKKNSVTADLYSNSSSDSVSSSECDDSAEEFYDAIATETSDGEDSDDDIEVDKKDIVTLENVSSDIASLSLKKSPANDASKVLDSAIPPVSIDSSKFSGSLRQGKDDDDTNCWTNPGGAGFMIRGSTYLEDYVKVP